MERTRLDWLPNWRRSDEPLRWRSWKLDEEDRRKFEIRFALFDRVFDFEVSAMTVVRRILLFFRQIVRIFDFRILLSFDRIVDIDKETTVESSYGRFDEWNSRWKFCVVDEVVVQIVANTLQHQRRSYFVANEPLTFIRHRGLAV
ncbi:hypothetical protein M3Y96_01244200 [Aphelenchoides besseyi]|nr:hypothetical protein M3Y96_01244200 [Aphelenchoides besseyi]